MDRLSIIKIIRTIMGTVPPEINDMDESELAVLLQETLYNPDGTCRFVCPHLSLEELQAEAKADGVTTHREIKNQLDTYCSEPAKRMLGLHGLRRTGKTVLMRSKALELMEEGRNGEAG